MDSDLPPLEAAVEPSTDQSSTNQSSNQQDDLPALESIEQSSTQSTNQSSNQLSDQASGQHTFSQDVSQSANQSVDQPPDGEKPVKTEPASVSQSVNASANQSVKAESSRSNGRSAIAPSSYQPASGNQSDDDIQEVVHVDDSEDDVIMLSDSSQSANQSRNQSNNQSHSRAGNQKKNELGSDVDDGDLAIVLSATDPVTFVGPFFTFEEPADQAAEPFKHPYVLALASSGRAKCRICSELINQGFPRYGQNTLKRNHMATLWYHAPCFLTRYLPKFKFNETDKQRVVANRGMVDEMRIYTAALDKMNEIHQPAWESVREEYEEREAQKQAYFANADPAELEEKRKKKAERAEKRKQKKKREKAREMERQERLKEKEKKQKAHLKKEEKKRIKQEEKKVKSEIKQEKVKKEGPVKQEGEKADSVRVKREKATAPRMESEPSEPRIPKVKREKAGDAEFQVSTRPSKRRRSTTASSSDVAVDGGSIGSDSAKRPRTRSMARS